MILPILALILLVLIYFGLSFKAIVRRLQAWNRDPLHGIILIGMMLIPFLLVTAPAADSDPIQFLRGVGIMLLYLYIPGLALIFRPRQNPSLDLYDLVAILTLWFPIEVGWLPQANIQLGSVTLPVPLLTAIDFGFLLYQVIRPLPGLGYTYRLGGRDFGYAFIGLAAFTLIGLPIGVALGFIRFGLDSFQPAAWLTRFLAIYFLNALPEELLFRGGLQNLIEQRFGCNLGTLVVPAILFGFTHINNFTNHNSPPNWPYVLMATIAGLAYGWVWRRSRKITASAVTHTGVNFIWSILFNG